ncbi:MAG: hypothetical protein HKN85_12830 [Gammaproteobacteria bacterium]|nr:hypothetical protein [Gammaproteobacteria bacterium]
MSILLWVANIDVDAADYDRYPGPWNRAGRGAHSDACLRQHVEQPRWKLCCSLVDHRKRPPSGFLPEPDESVRP